MFVPVACLTCGKLFQVPPAAAGTDVPCPWCKATTPALPVAGVAPAPATSETGGLTPPARPEQPDPLSLDDAPAPEPPAKAIPVRPASVPLPATPPKPRSPVVKGLLVGGLSVVACLAALVVSLLISGRTIPLPGAGHVPDSAWAEFTPPDGSCSFALPGVPAAEAVDPNPAAPATRGGERYVTTGWYSRATAWVGWQNLDPEWVKQASLDRDGLLIAPLLAAELSRRKEQTGGTVTKEGAARFGAQPGLEVQMDTPRGTLVERYVLALDGPRPRLYFLGVESKAATPDGPAARRLFNSFRPGK
jgi:hypothetical protein